MKDTPYIFISYSRRDGAFVDALIDDLNEKGIKIWRDTAQIEAGENWMSALEQGIKGADILIYVMSRHSVKSQWMANELAASHTHGKMVIPLIIDSIHEGTIPEYIKNIQWIDFTIEYASAFSKLLAAIPDRLKSTAPLQKEESKSKGYVFISYAEEDYDFVESLKGFLKEKGYAYWDYAESDRNYHTQFFLELESVITEANATLSILSKHWKASQWALKEFIFSEEVGIPVFLLRAKEIGPTLVIAGLPYIDFVLDSDAGYAKLDRELQRKGL